MALLALACASPAAAGVATPVEHVNGFVSDLRVRGTSFAWMSQLCRDRACDRYDFSIVRAGLDGRDRRRLARGSIDARSRDALAGFDLSGSSVAISRSMSGPSADSSSLGFGPAPGRRRRLYSCLHEPPAGGYAVDGDRVLYEDPCVPGGGLLVLADRRSGRKALIASETESGRIGALRLEGDWIAWTVEQVVENEVRYAIQVRSVDGRQGYRLPPERRRYQPGLALDGRGRVALIDDQRPANAKFSACSGYSVRWASPQRPSPSLLTRSVCGGRIAWAGDRLIVRAPAGKGRGAIRFVGLDGTATTRVEMSREGLDSFDASGSRLVFATTACRGGTDIYSVRARGPRIRLGSATCPVRVGRVSRLRGRTVRLRLRCPRGCSGQLRLIRGGRTLLRRPVRLRRGTVRLRLGRALARRIRVERSVTAFVVMQSPDRTYDRRPRRIVRRITLRAR